MTANITQASGTLFTVNVSGELKKHEYEGLQAVAEKLMAKAGPIKILLIVEDFAGWERGVDWGDLDFMMAHEDDIGRIAVIGEERWRDDLLMFLGAGLRGAGVLFFPPEQRELAEAWLESD